MCRIEQRIGEGFHWIRQLTLLESMNNRAKTYRTIGNYFMFDTIWFTLLIQRLRSKFLHSLARCELMKYAWL